jgi:hypothetical protein
MAEPSIPFVTVTVAASAVSVTTVQLFGVPLGLRPELLVAGFSGALAGISMLNTVPSSGDTWLHMVRTSWRRMSVAVCSSLLAGYMAPLFANETWLLGTGVVIGAGAQVILGAAVQSLRNQVLGRGRGLGGNEREGQ